VYNADKIWDILDISRSNFITYKQFSEDIKIQRDFCYTTNKITNFLCIFIINLVVVWSIFPLILNSFMGKSNEGIRRYENVINLRFPVSIQVFNDFFVFFYAIEVIALVFIAYAVLVVDTFLIIHISRVLLALYDISTKSFSCIGYEQQFKNGKLMALL